MLCPGTSGRLPNIALVSTHFTLLHQPTVFLVIKSFLNIGQFFFFIKSNKKVSCFHLLLVKSSLWRWAERISWKEQEVKMTLTVSLVGTELQSTEFDEESFLLLPTPFYAPAIPNLQPISAQPAGQSCPACLRLHVIAHSICLSWHAGCATNKMPNDQNTTNALLLLWFCRMCPITSRSLNFLLKTKKIENAIDLHQQAKTIKRFPIPVCPVSCQSLNSQFNSPSSQCY